ncbi:hypothetical protein BDGGKGIB_01291 [Nodularia sphaerocarpa UHCC 0038]|nr:hypothetical protein BDGGKGIB_01291 [Nodularia sphaerocarpa UHCC 0038]
MPSMFQVFLNLFMGRKTYELRIILTTDLITGLAIASKLLAKNVIFAIGVRKHVE